MKRPIVKSKLIALFTIIILILLIILVYRSVKTQQRIIASQKVSTSGAFSTTLDSNASTESVRPTKTPYGLPKGDFEKSWDTYNFVYNSTGGIITIRRQGAKYTMEKVMYDGSGKTYDLTVISAGDEIKLTDHPGNPAGDYLLISKEGYLSFYNKQGLMYSVSELK